MTDLAILADENMAGVASLFDALGRVQQKAGRHIQQADLVDIDVLLVRSVTRVDAQLLEGTAVKFVGSATSGFDHVDRAYLSQAGIEFAYAPGANANSVVEYVLSVLLQDLSRFERLLAGAASYGIVGYGHVGQLLHHRLAALGVECVLYDPWLADSHAQVTDQLAAVLRCDVISIHAELTEALPWPSKHLFDDAALQAMGDNTLLINAGRGGIIDNRALFQCLGRARAPKVVLDVWEAEPFIDRHLLSRLWLGTPHIAGYSLDGKVLATQMLAQAVAKHIGGLEPGADDASPLGQNPVLELPAGLERVAMCQWLLSQVYDVKQDDLVIC